MDDNEEDVDAARDERIVLDLAVLLSHFSNNEQGLHRHTLAPRNSHGTPRRAPRADQELRVRRSGRSCAAVEACRCR